MDDIYIFAVNDAHIESRLEEALMSGRGRYTLDSGEEVEERCFLTNDLLQAASHASTTNQETILHLRKAGSGLRSGEYLAYLITVDLRYGLDPEEWPETYLGVWKQVADRPEFGDYSEFGGAFFQVT